MSIPPADPFDLLDDMLLEDVVAESKSLPISVPTGDNFLDANAISMEASSSQVGAELAVFDGTDPRLLNLSHSSRLLEHLCPRKYQLYRLNSREQDLDDGGAQRLTFDYGTVVGLGIQDILEGKSENEIYLNMFCAWEGDLLAENRKQNKDFWGALLAVQRFIGLRASGYLDEYELVYYEGRPAVELSFRIHLPGGYKYRGYVDAVLRHKVTGEILVLECKTSSFTNITSVMFKNSGQAVGYSIVLDSLFPTMNSYTVLYLVYSTKAMEYKELSFDKTLYQRALWLQELVLDTRILDLYINTGVFPMHGESCNAWFRECEYFGLCTMSTERLTKELTQVELEKLQSEEYQFEVNFDALIQDQLKLSEDTKEITHE